MSEDKKSFGDKLFSKFIVVLVVVLNVAFTATILLIYFLLQEPPSDTLIIAWFGFTVGELGLLTYIKKQDDYVKVKQMEHMPGHAFNDKDIFGDSKDLEKAKDGKK